MLRSPILLLCHALYTCGTNVMLLKKDPKRPAASTQNAVIKYGLNVEKLTGDPINFSTVNYL